MKTRHRVLSNLFEVTAEGAATPGRPRVRARWVVLGLLVVLVALVVWAVLATLAARHRLEQARGDLVDLRTNGQGNYEAVTARLARDLDRVRSAKSLLDQPGPAIVSHIPLLGRSFVAARTVADASVAAVDAGLATARDAHGIGAAGSVDLTRLATVHNDLVARAAALQGPLHKLANLDVGWTPSPVGSGVRRAQNALLGLDTDVARAASFAEALHGLLGGDGTRRVLVALENNAELRGTGGLISTFAVGTAVDGRLDLGPFRDVVSVSDQPASAVRVPAPPDYTRHYGPYLANSTLWKNVNQDPDVPTAAQVLSEIAGRSLKVKPDVIVFVDVPAMSGIVTRTGPITVDGQQLNGHQLTQRLLVDSYRSAGNTLAEQVARRHRLEAAASAAVSRLTHAHATLGLVRTLATLTSGRHIALWSARPDEQSDLQAAGAAGSVTTPSGTDVALVTTSNLGDSFVQRGVSGSGNKLDFYAHRSLTVHALVGTRTTEVTETLTIRNNAPAGLGPYVEGPKHPGRLHELLALSTDGDAEFRSFTSGGADVPVTEDSEHGHRRIPFVVDLQRGESRTWVLRYGLQTPHGYRLDLLPQPLASPADLTLTVVGAGGPLDWLGSGQHVVDGRIDISVPWSRTVHVAVKVHQRTFWQKIKHAVGL